jgi:hypothetical protein
MEVLLHLRFSGAVEFIRVVLAVVITITSPRGLDAQAVVALELIGSAVHVEACHENRSHRGLKYRVSLGGNPGSNNYKSRNDLQAGNATGF